MEKYRCDQEFQQLFGNFQNLVTNHAIFSQPILQLIFQEIILFKPNLGAIGAFAYKIERILFYEKQTFSSLQGFQQFFFKFSKSSCQRRY